MLKTLAPMWPTHTEKPQTMHESRNYVVNGDDQDSYDARQNLKGSTRESGLPGYQGHTIE